MPFFKEDERRQTEVSPFGLRCARILSEAVKRHSKFRNRHSLKTWGAVFDKMVKSEIPKDRIKMVLNWYCKNIGRQYVPQAFSATTFREKFLQIEAAIQRKGEDIVDVLSDPAIRVAADEIQLMAGDLIWKGKEKEQEIIFIGISLFNYKKFLDDLYALKETVDTDTIHLIEFVLNWLNHDCNEAITAWLIRVHNNALRWDDWSGDLLPMVWSKKHSWVTAQGRTIAREWDADPFLWDRLIEKLNGGQ